MKKCLLLILTLILCCIETDVVASVELFCPDNVDLGCNPKNIKRPNPNSLKYKTDCRRAKVELIDEILTVNEEGCRFKLELVYKATDECGDMDRCVMTITWIEDKEAPMFVNCRTEFDLGCNPNYIPPADPTELEAKDNCGIKEIVLHKEKYKTQKCKSTLTREYRAYDFCGNFTTCTQVWTWITDYEPPQTECKDIFLGCDFDGIPAPDPSSVKAKDNCCLGETIHLFDSDITVFGCEYSLLRYYETSDCCGNKDTCIQTISWIEDDDPPYFTACPPDIDLGCNPDIDDIADPSINFVAAEDECGDVKIELVGDVTNNEGCEYKRTQRWKATDECGNMSFCERTISYTLDDSPPVIIECPPDIDLGCIGTEFFELPEPTPELLIWEDDCDAEVTVEEGFDIVVVGCTSYYTRKYIVTDKCGNTDECFQTISWTFDNHPPVFTKCPPHIDLGCNPDPGDIIIDPGSVEVEAEDECGEVEITYEGDEIIEDGCTIIRIQTWKATDPCGNMSFCRRRISYTIDNEPPIITKCPEDVDLGCFTQPPSFVEDPFVVIEAEDNCGDVHIEYIGYEDEVDGCMYFRTHTWEVKDDCGNASYCDFTIKFTVDPDPPVIIECPEDIHLGCVEDGFEIPPPTPEDLVWEDNCGEATVEVIESFSLLSIGCTTYQTNKYIVKDACGNISECFQTISWIYDVTPPIFTHCPPDIDLGCNPTIDDIADPSINFVAAVDLCGEVDIEKLEDQVINEGCYYKRIQTWKATDPCGNMSTCQRVISYILDPEPPVIINCPPDIDYGCVGPDFELPEPNADLLEVESDCDYEVEIIPFSDIIVVNCEFIFGYIYRVTDACGREVECFQSVRWTMDNIPPSFTYCPPDVDLGCNPTEAEIDEVLNDKPTAEDFCSDVAITLVNQDTTEDGCMVTILQRWVARDQCGNINVCSREVTYKIDTEPPQIISCPPSSHLGCLQIAPLFAPFDPDDYDVTDNCGNVNFAHYDIIVDSDTEECLRTFRRFVTIFDDCGNLNSCITEYSWYEVDNPQLDIPFPEDLTIVCGDRPPVPDFGDRNCGIGVPQFEQEIVIGDCNTGNCTIIRIWSKKDCNGDVVFHAQVITLICQDITTLRDDINTRNNPNPNLGFKLFPNPGSNNLNIESHIPHNNRMQILIFDQSGKLIFNQTEVSQGKNLKTIDVKEYTPGIYYIEVRSESFRSLKKWIKSN